MILRRAVTFMVLSLCLVAGTATATTTSHQFAASVTAAEQYSSVSLGFVANASLDGYSPAPLGSPIMLGGVPFNIPGGLNALLTQTCCNGGPVQASIPASIANATAVHLLINTGNSFFEAGAVVGNVRFDFADASSQTVNLVLGQNVREWAADTPDSRVPASARVTTEPNSTEVWRASSGHGPNSAVIDKLLIPLAVGGKTLTSIVITDTSTTTAPSGPAGPEDFAIILAGITVESASATASITVHKFEDSNQDAEQDPGEQNLSGWAMTLYRGGDCTGTIVDANTTDASGAAKFENLEPGRYSLNEIQQPGWVRTTQPECVPVDLKAEP